MNTPQRITVVSGAQEFLADRAISRLVEQWRATGADIHELSAEADDVVGLAMSAASPDLFGGEPVIVIRHFEKISDARATSLMELMTDHSTCGWIVGYLAPRTSKVRTAVEKSADAVVKVQPLKGKAVAEFLHHELREHGKTTDRDTVTFLLQAVGNDPRALASAAEQLARDITDRHIGREQAGQYYAGRIEVKGYEIAEAMAKRDTASAVSSLRFAVRENGPGIGLMIVSSIATTFRRLAVAQSARSASAAADVASTLGVPEWIARQVVRDAQLWSRSEIRAVLAELTELTVILKGGYVSGEAWTDEQKIYRLERLITLHSGDARQAGTRL